MKIFLLSFLTLISFCNFSQTYPVFTIPSYCKNKYVKITSVTTKTNETIKENGVFPRTSLSFVLANGKKLNWHVDLPYGLTPNSPNTEIYNGSVVFKGLSKSKYFYVTVTKGWSWYMPEDGNSRWAETYTIQASYVSDYGGGTVSQNDLNYELPVSEAGNFEGLNGDVIVFWSPNSGSFSLYPQLTEDPNSTNCKLKWCVGCLDLDSTD